MLTMWLYHERRAIQQYYRCIVSVITKTIKACMNHTKTRKLQLLRTLLRLWRPHIHCCCSGAKREKLKAFSWAKTPFVFWYVPVFGSMWTGIPAFGTCPKSDTKKLILEVQEKAKKKKLDMGVLKKGTAVLTQEAYYCCRYNMCFSVQTPRMGFSMAVLKCYTYK